MTYTVIIKPAKGDGHCPDFVLKNETTTEECNKQPCGESYNYVACASVRHKQTSCVVETCKILFSGCSNYYSSYTRPLYILPVYLHLFTVKS